MPVWRLALFGAAAGSADAASFITAGAFTANMTGNTILLAIAVVQGPLAHIVRPAVALLSYVGGVMLGARLSARRPQRILVLELVLAACSALAAYLGVRSSDPWHSLLIVPFAATMMGLQSAWLKASGIRGVSTTFMTGTWTSLVFDYSAGALRSVDRARGYIIAAVFAGAALAALLATRLPPAMGLPPLLALAIAMLGAKVPAKAGPAGSREPATR
jgi:uncharacterized membrane protein YoaK (UPF0700 family)